MLIGNGRVITHNEMEPFFENGAVYILDGKILDMGDTETLRSKYPDEEFIDVDGKIIMPGIINTHHHIYSAFARGMATLGSPKNFLEVLETLWWKVDKKLNHDDIKYSALTTYIDSIKNGVTTVFDHHAGPNSITGSLDVIADAAKKLGIRTCLCYEVSDRDGINIMQEGIDENINFIKKYNNSSENMIRGMFGLHASFTLCDESMKKCQEAMNGIDAGYHVHTAEGIDDLYDSLENHGGKRVVERLYDFGVLGDKTIAVHCIHVNDFELELLKKTNTNVVHNPESNMGNAVGCAPVLETFAKGINIGLGTDGFTNDMFESLKVGNILHKHNKCSPSVAWGEIPEMLFKNNRKIAEKYFIGKFGVIEKDANADIIIVDYDPLTEMNENNYNSHLLFGVMGKNVVSTIINGKFIMKDRKILTVDEKDVFKKSREISRKMWDRN